MQKPPARSDSRIPRSMIELHAGPWLAAVCPGCGMNLIDLRWNGHPILRTPKDETMLRNHRFLYGTPLLFPANRTAGGTFSFRGSSYTLPITEPQHGNNLHGLMADAPFTVVSQTANEVCAVQHNRGARYPFAFDMTITDTLSSSGWERRVHLLALQDMPFTLAFHTTFAEPKAFSVPVGRRFLCNDHFIPTGEMTPAEPFGQIISGFYEAAGHSATLDDFTFSVSGNFDQWVLYNGGGQQGFLCVEPQCGGVNGLNTTAHRILSAGESETFMLSIGRQGE